MTKPNIILLMCDQYRGDCLSFLDHADVKTPYLDTMAADGFCFDHAYSACPSCIPARAALFTGLDQKNHRRVGYQDGIDWEYPHMLAEELRNNGYQTQCIGKMHVHPPRLSCGFDNIKLHDGYIGHYRKANTPYWQHQNISDDYMYHLKQNKGIKADVNATGVENNSWITHPWIYEEELHPTNWVVDESIRFLETRDRSKPFFLMASFVRPHPPFDAPKNYFDMYYGKDLKEPAVGEWVDPSLTERDGRTMDSIHGCKDAELRHQAMAGYYACITHIDHQIGRFITALENDETYNNSIIIFTSDHGEMLFDHQKFRKVLPYEGSTRVPLIIHVGKKVAKTHPALCHDVVELRDIMPTILDFAGIECPEVDGLSLKDVCINAKALNRDYIHGEHARDREQSNHYIVTNTDKYIWYSQTGIEQYFDLIHDRDETHDLINDENCQDRIQQLRQYLINELKDREEGFTDGKELFAGKPLVSFLTK